MDINILLILQSFREGPGALFTSFLSKVITSFIQMFYIIFLFPVIIKITERSRSGESGA